MTHNGLLPWPPQPSWTRRCESCQRRWALEWVSDRPDPIATRVVTYRCRYCGVEIEYARLRPPRAV